MLNLKMTIPISSCQMSLSPTPEHPRGRRRRRRKFSSTTLTLLILTTFSFKISWADKVPVPDDCSSSPYEDGLALECSLSAINSVDEKTNFSVVPSDHTLALTVKCREPTLSQLEADGFRSLRHLKRLVLDGCNLKVIPSRAFWGLDKLESLTVWTRQAGVLTIDRAAFFGLGNLLRLDLSGNYIRFLPPEALCPLPRLQTLNLSHNEVGSLSDIGADSSKGCISSLSSVDLSYNELSGLTTRQMSSMTSLNEIWLGHNYIRSVDPDIFRASSDKLNFVDLSNNQLSNLPAELFAGARNLERVSLANNTLNQLSDKMFASQQRRLQVVDLSGNLLRSIGESLLKNQTSLTSLDLGYNELESLKPGTFSDLKSLQFLKMDHNRLTRFSPDLFASLTQLHTLVLSGNALAALPTRLFSNLGSLSHLLLDYNHLDELPNQMFNRSTNRITVLDLSHNRLKTISSFVEPLVQLQSLSLSQNQISDLGKLELPSLWRLQASGNQLQTISSGHLKGLPALQVLDLSGNSISSLDKDAFKFNLPLQAIRLDANKLKRMDSVFGDLPHLSWLNVSANEITTFDYAMVPRTLRWLDLHQNYITSLENYFSIEAESQLAFIDASFNKIEDIGPQNVPNDIETMLLNDNLIQTIGPYTFFKKAKLKKVDFTVNRLESIDRNALRLPAEITMQPSIHLGGNPIRCDCHMAWFKTINVDNALQSFPIVADLESIYCQLLYSRGRSFVPLVDAAPEDFLCTYETHCFALCHCCDYDACDCEMTCPENCTCYHDNSWSKNIVQCSSANFRELPDQLPMDATEIFLDGNNLTDLKSHTFIGRKNLKTLYLNNTFLSAVENHTFNGLNVLEELHLEGNAITRLQGDEFHGLKALKELYLHNNLIRIVNNATFRELSSLRVLTLHSNRLREFPAWQLELNPALSRALLSDNPWTCECRFVKSFGDWLIKGGSEIVKDAEEIRCFAISGILNEDEESLMLASALTTTSIDDSAVRNIINLADRNGSNSNTCQDVATATTHVQEERVARDFLPLLLATLACFGVVAILVVCLFVYRHEMRVWLHSKYGVRFFQRIDAVADSEKIFDAFVTYSAKDDVFVRQVLAPELELGRTVLGMSPTTPTPPSQSYRLCLFYRDLPVQAYLADTLVQATEASRRTILVLSENFLKSEWSRYDYKSGLHQALRTSAHKKLIVIVLGDVAGRDIDPDIRLYLKSSLVLHWGDKHFWDKLRYALPDVRSQAEDTYSFRYETVPRRGYSEQDSTRTMTIHI